VRARRGDGDRPGVRAGLARGERHDLHGLELAVVADAPVHALHDDVVRAETAEVHAHRDLARLAGSRRLVVELDGGHGDAVPRRGDALAPRGQRRGRGGPVRGQVDRGPRRRLVERRRVIADHA
jgi:hypothetical protein